MPNTTRNRHYSSKLASASKFFLTLLLFAVISTLTTAQRYTVNRPTTVPVPPPPPLTEAPLEQPTYNPADIRWKTDYEYARNMAKQSARNLLIYLYADEDLPELPRASACRTFETVVLNNVSVRSELDGYIPLRLPIDTVITDENGMQVSLLSLPGFEHMLGLPGLVVIDFAHWDTAYYGQVTGILPFLRGECPTEQQAETFLKLPPGTLTQRTLTYAVRIHPDRPLSSDGETLPIIMQVAVEHASYQAERGVLGHQNFSKRSSQVREVLGSGMPSEICAQSRSDENLFEGAIGCMRAWRRSSAHWSIAKKSHRYYGYDMVCGKNGAWYAVGFFMD